MPKKMTHEEFIQKLKIQHPNLEVLSQYNGNKNRITVKCKIHNHIFETKPNWLNKGIGCKYCYDERRGDTLRKTLDECIHDMRKVHGNKYDYSQIKKYENNHTKLPIVCPTHGLFWMSYGKHVNRGQGCPKCAAELNGFNKRLPSDVFFQRCKEKHNNYYSYDESSFNGVDKTIVVYCPIHGEFEQSAYGHMNGCGCPKCNSSHLEKNIKHLLTHEGIKFIEQYKFNELGLQSLDFYLPEYNVAIECQGGQHLFPIEHFGGEKEFLKIKERDIRKFNICKENGIKLVYIILEKYQSVLEKSINEENSIYNNNNSFIFEKIDKIEQLLL